jgi:hypothetical protein
MTDALKKRKKNKKKKYIAIIETRAGAKGALRTHRTTPVCEKRGRH